MTTTDLVPIEAEETTVAETAEEPVEETLPEYDGVRQFTRAPWLGFGTDVRGIDTAQEALIAGGLDFTTRLESTYFKGANGKYAEIPNRYAIVRDDTDQPLGVAGRDYRPVAIRDALSFADNLVQDGKLVYEAVGPFAGGTQAFIVGRFTEHVTVDGDDPMVMSLLLRTGLIPGKSISAEIVPLVVRCTNTFGTASRQSLATWRVNHVSTAKAKLEQAHEALERLVAYGDDLSKTAARLAAVDVEIDEFKRMLELVLPDRPRKEEQVATILTKFQHSELINPNARGTGWGAVNALTEYADHGRQVTRASSAAARFETATHGQWARTRDRLTGLILKRG